MRCNIKLVRLLEIDVENDFFRITTHGNLKPLADSILAAGIINPPLLIKDNKKYIIISGFRRIKACRKLGWTEVKARIINNGPDKIQCAKIAIADNALQRPLNFVEQARSINLLAGFVDGKDNLSVELGKLGLPKNPAIVTKLKTICQFSKIIQQGIISGTISLTAAIELDSLDHEAGEKLAVLLNDLKVSLNKQKQIILLLKEISRREDLTIVDIIKEDEIQNCFNDKDMDRNRKANQIIHYLKKRRFPQITTSEKKFNAMIKKIKLGNHFKLIPPKNFECTDYTLNISFKNYNELKHHRKTLSSIIRNPILKKILERP